MKKVLQLIVKNKVALLMAALSLPATVSMAQDPEMTQFYAAPVYTNPAMAGTGSCGGRINLNYRNQWPTLDGTFRTFVASYDEHFGSISGGVGLMAMKDVAGQGLLTTTQFSGVYSYYLKPNRYSKVSMRFGVQADFMQKSLDWTKLRFADQIDPIKGFINPTKEPEPGANVTYPNFSTGFLLYTDNFYGGVAVHNLTEPNQSFYNSPDEVLPRRYTAHAGLHISLEGKRRVTSDEDNSISPNILFMLQQKFTQINLGFYANRGPLVTGLWFRQTAGTYSNSDALIALIGFRKDKFKFGYSYDITVSSARAAVPGSHEISAAIEWCRRTPIRKYTPPKCPDF